MKTEIIPVSFGFVKAFLVKGDRTIIVDAGLKGSEKKILRAMAAHDIKPSDVSLLLVTHTHMDHAGGLKALKEATGAPVAVSALEAACLADGKGAPVAVRSFAMRLLSVFTRRMKMVGVQPDVLIGEKLTLDEYGVEGFAFPTPGHTLGSVTVVMASGDAIVGDMVNGGAKPALPDIYQDMEALKASIWLLKQTNAQTVYTSHAGVYAIGDVLALVALAARN